MRRLLPDNQVPGAAWMVVLAAGEAGDVDEVA
jgi:hypothetical protein